MYGVNVSNVYVSDNEDARSGIDSSTLLRAYGQGQDENV